MVKWFCVGSVLCVCGFWGFVLLLLVGLVLLGMVWVWEEVGGGFSLYLFYFNLVEGVCIVVFVICGEEVLVCGFLCFIEDFYCKLVGGFVVGGDFN